jgi:hypothetical protein
MPAATLLRPDPSLATRPPAGVRGGVVGPDAATLERIFDEGIAVAAWRRGPQPALAATLAATLPHEERVVRESLRAAEPDLGRVNAALGCAAGTALEPWLRELVDVYAILADADEVGLRLCVTRGQPCPRFHVDRVGLRLICTLRGPGTEWLAHADVDRRRLGLAGATDDASGLLRPGATVQRLEPCDVGIFKGEAWPGNEGRGAVHRSPPTDGGWRLLVTLDAL